MCWYLKQKSTLNISFLKNKMTNKHCVSFYSCAKLHSQVSLVTWDLKSGSRAIKPHNLENIHVEIKKAVIVRGHLFTFIFHTYRIADTNDHLIKKRRVAVSSLKASRLGLIKVLPPVDTFLSNRKKIKDWKTGGRELGEQGNPMHWQRIGWARGDDQERLKNNNSSEAQSPGQLQWPFGTYFSQKDIYEWHWESWPTDFPKFIFIIIEYL